MYKLALFGRNISHSKSEQVYSQILKKEFEYIKFDIDSVEKFQKKIKIEIKKFNGVSITSPFKQEAFKACEKVFHIPNSLSSVNCLKFEAGKIVGTNTDYIALKEIISEYKNQDINILGDGAMGTAIKLICIEMKLPFKQFSRKVDGDINSLDLSDLNGILFNTCSRDFIFKNNSLKNIIFYDLNYSMPEHFSFFQSKKMDYIDGMQLLLDQARHACKFWGI